jgi:hypothetical protein
MRVQRSVSGEVRGGGGMRFASVNCLAAIAAWVAAVSPGASQTINQFIGFGDSTIDSGWYRNAAPNSTNPIYNTDFPIAVTQGGDCDHFGSVGCFGQHGLCGAGQVHAARIFGFQRI